MQLMLGHDLFQSIAEEVKSSTQLTLSRGLFQSVIEGKKVTHTTDAGS